MSILNLLFGRSDNNRYQEARRKLSEAAVGGINKDENPHWKTAKPASSLYDDYDFGLGKVVTLADAAALQRRRLASLRTLEREFTAGQINEATFVADYKTMYGFEPDNMTMAHLRRSRAVKDVRHQSYREILPETEIPFPPRPVVTPENDDKKFLDILSDLCTGYMLANAKVDVDASQRIAKAAQGIYRQRYGSK